MKVALPTGRTQPGTTAFTLLELLVVIGIIAILASLLLPALSGTRQLTQTAACKNRLRQIGFALALYTRDFAVYPNTFEKLDRYLVRNRQQPTAGSDQFRCPSKLTYVLNVYGSLPWPQDSPKQETNLSLGLSLTCPTDPKCGPLLPEGGVAVPSDMFATGDAVVTGPVEAARERFFASGVHFLPEYVHRPNRANPDIGAANMLFCDGHVEEGPRSVWEARTEAARRRWNRDHLPHNEQFAGEHEFRKPTP